MIRGDRVQQSSFVSCFSLYDVQQNPTIQAQNKPIPKPKTKAKAKFSSNPHPTTLPEPHPKTLLQTRTYHAPNPGLAPPRFCLCLDVGFRLGQQERIEHGG